VADAGRSLNPPDKWIIQEVPTLRIVDDALWQNVMTRQRSIRDSDQVAKARATRFWEKAPVTPPTQRPRILPRMR
jgi:hypothetical protein